jgi:tRNA threonylcarbamoyladenosine biosynthesis protein TsaB
MKILALDTALNACSVAITDDGNVRAYLHEKRARGHAETLMPMVQNLMKRADLIYSDLDLIAVTVGPGTFTGLRIGLAAARGISLASKTPLLGITTLEALAASVPPEISQNRSIIATADARRGEIYLQTFQRTPEKRNILALCEPMAVPVENANVSFPAEGGVILGSGTPLLEAQDFFRNSRLEILDLDPDPDAIIIADIASHKPFPNFEDGPPAPLYLRAPDAKPSKT